MSAATVTRARFLPRDAWAVLGSDFLSAVGSGLTLPFFVVYLHAARGMALSTAGLAAATVALASFAGNPLGGVLADRRGARNTVVVGLVLSAVGAVAVTLVRQPAHAFVAAALVGLGASITWPAQDSLLATVVADDQRSRVFSIRYATMNAGFGIGALVAATIVVATDPHTFVVLYRLDALSFLIGIPLLGSVRQQPPPTRQVTGGYRAVLADPLFRRVFALTALVVAASYGQFHTAFPVYATQRIPARNLSIAFAANTFTVVFAQLVVLRAFSGRRRTFAVTVACGLWAAAWGLALVGGHLGGTGPATVCFTLTLVVFALAETTLSPTLPAIVNDLAPDELRGRYNGLATMAWTTGFFAGPVVAGFALDAGAGTALFLGLIAACGLAAAGARRLQRHLPAEANLIG